MNELAKMINRFSSGDGLHPSSVPGVSCIKMSQADRRRKNHWRSGLAIVAQGCKEIIFGSRTYRCDEYDYIATPLDLPVTSRIYSATSETPFLCLKLEFDSLILGEMTAQIETHSEKASEAPLRAMFIGKANERMLEAALRYGRIFSSPEEAPILGELVTREIFYHLLKGEDGAAIRQFLRSGSRMNKISQAIYRLGSELSEDIEISELAKAANMSRSAFFKQFKEVTALSPIQYQKRLRLLEARRLMIEDGENAESAAYKVGYKSSSQFSREYSRMFAKPPHRDIANINK